MRRIGPTPLIAIALLLLPGAPAAGARRAGTFVEASAAAALVASHGFTGTAPSDLDTMARLIAGGAAAADYDRDGDVDLYFARGDVGPNLLFRNRGDGTFEEVGAAAGVAGAPSRASGPVFADIDGDGWLDLLVGAIEGERGAVYRNRGDGTFEDVSASSGLDDARPRFSMALADVDGDGDLDVAAAHWLYEDRVTLWRNDGSGHFEEVGLAAGLDRGPYAFTPTFADLTGDGRPDLVVAADFGTSAVYANLGGGRFGRLAEPAVTDENGMGGAVADADLDGDLDWFVSSVWDADGVAEGNWGVTGNRLYRNPGDGRLEDATDAAGVREGDWGWGACFADFDDDGDEDLFHVNGFSLDKAGQFLSDPARLFLNRGDGGFQERAAALGIADPGQGRAVLCFDFDGDGDLDVFIANNGAPARLYRNDGVGSGGSLEVTLSGRSPNTEAIGARIEVTTAGATQVREIRAGGAFEAAGPARAHFGLGAAARADEVRVRWPDGRTSIRRDVPAGTRLAITEPAAPAVPALGAAWLLAAGLLLSGWLRLRRKVRSAQPAGARR